MLYVETLFYVCFDFHLNLFQGDFDLNRLTLADFELICKSIFDIMIYDLLI